ncbi:MAG: hypothetical protein IKT40_12475 [Bacilli bacterium]|nr:hypothetical protein [Bacilli bacterium]
MIEVIKYDPSEMDLFHVQEIRDFLISKEIEFIEDEEIFGLFHVNDKTCQLRYVNSYFHPIDNSRRFGDICKGIPQTYFSEISHINADNGIRTIWIFDFEMEQTNDALVNGEIVQNFRRQWEVIKNTICTACGRIDKRIYARDTEAREITNTYARPFLEANCFYGYRSATKTVGLFLKKDKKGLKAGTLLMVYSFGANFYGNKKFQDNPKIEIIRVSTLLGCQVIGGMSKCLKHFLQENPTMEVGGRTVSADKYIFYVDASHNDARGMKADGLGFNFVSWDKQGGFMNRWTCDHEEVVIKDDKKITLKGKRGEIFHRKPLFHKEIMRLIGEGKIVSIGNAGTIVFEMTREEYLSRFEDTKDIIENNNNNINKTDNNG